MNLNNDEAQFLINLQKQMMDTILKFPPPGKFANYQATDLENTRKFIFRTRPAQGNHPGRRKITYNLFYDGLQLLRLDTYGTGAHTNKDGTIIPAHTPHIHIYDEKEDDHNAYLLPSSFTSPEDFLQTLLDFLDYTNVIDVNNIQIVEQGGLIPNDIH